MDSRSKTHSKLKKEVYYFCIDHAKSHIVKEDDTHYTNTLIIPLYMTPHMNEAIVGYYTAFNIHIIKDDKNKIHTEATITTPHGTILATTDYVTVADKNYLTMKTQQRVNFKQESGSGYYKSPQIVVTVLSLVNRQLSISSK
jgi:hypothetical protein